MRRFFSFSSNSVLYRLTMAFGLFFFCPFLGLLFLSLKTDLFGTQELLYCVGGLLISTFFGYIILHQISKGISRVEKRMYSRVEDIVPTSFLGEDEIGNISMFADLMSENIKNADLFLHRRANESLALEELGGLSAFQVGTKSFLRISLERSIEVVHGCGGAILLITGSKGVCLQVLGEVGNLEIDTPFSVSGFVCDTVDGKRAPQLLTAQQVADHFGLHLEEQLSSVLVYMGHFGVTAAFALITSDSDKVLDNNTLSFLNTYFSTVGSKIKMVEIDIRERRTSDELNIVLSIITVLNSNPREDDILAIIAQKVNLVLPHRWIGIVMKNSDTGNLYLSHSMSRTGNFVKTGWVIGDKKSLFHLAMHQDEPFAVRGFEGSSFYEKEIFTELGLKSALFAPLSSGGRTVGIICIGREGDGRFGIKEKRLFFFIAKGVSIALEQSRAFARERAKRAELEILNKIGGALSSHTIKTKQILPYVLDRIRELVEVEAGRIMMLEYDALRVEAVRGFSQKDMLHRRFRLDHGVAGYVGATGEPVIIEDVSRHPDFLAADDGKTGFETRTLLCVPMISGGRVIGVIELLNRVGRPFSEEDMQTVKAVAASVAIALENTRLYSESNYIAQKEKYIRSVFQRYVPEEVVADILQQSNNDWMDVGRRRIVTIFNVDIRGYTRLSKQASSEDVVYILNHFFKEMGQIVLKHKGVVDKYLGDGMLAIFGAPVPAQNPALDAVLAAKEMVASVDKVSRIAQERCGVPFSIGIAVNTGEAIVGNIGFSKKMEYTVIGDVVNEAFRIQDCTRGKKNMILIGESTYKQVGSVIKTKDHGLKSFDSGDVELYEVLTGREERETTIQEKVVRLH